MCWREDRKIGKARSRKCAGWVRCKARTSKGMSGGREVEKYEKYKKFCWRDLMPAPLGKAVDPPPLWAPSPLGIVLISSSTWDSQNRAFPATPKRCGALECFF